MSDIEETRAIVDAGEAYEGSVIPTRQAEIDRPVTIREGATVTEGVYGETVTVESAATVDGPAMAKAAVEIDGGAIDGDVGTPGRIEAEGATIGGTVTGSRVNLVDTTVVGNVVAGEAILEDCTVLGTVVGEQRLEMDATTCYTFRSYIDGDFEDVGILLPQAVVDGSFSLASPIEVRSIRRKPQFVEGDDRVPTLTAEDCRTIEGTTYLTLVPRLLDVEAVESRLEAIESFLRAVVRASHDETAVEPPEGAGWVLDALEVTAEEVGLSEAE